MKTILTGLIFAILCAPSARGVAISSADQERQTTRLDQGQILALENAERTINDYIRVAHLGNRESSERALMGVRRSIQALNYAKIPTRIAPYELTDRKLASYLEKLPRSPVKVAAIGDWFEPVIRACVIVAATFTCFDKADAFPLEVLPERRRQERLH